MKVQTEIRIGVGVLVGLQFFLALSAIGLLTRMSPAIDNVVRENVVSVHSVEDMLSALVLTSASLETSAQFTAALNRAKSNVTESDELPELEAIETLSNQYFSGDKGVTANLVSHLNNLGDINRRAISAASTTVKWTGMAGTWSAVLLALFGFGLSVVLVRRVTQRILWPLHELRDTIQSYVRGNTMRRCATMPTAAELGEVAQGLNAVLDGFVVQTSQQYRATDPRTRDRAVLLYVLDQHIVPTAVLDHQGEIVAANRLAQQTLTGRHNPEVLLALKTAREQGPNDIVTVITPIPNTPTPVWFVHWAMAAPKSLPAKSMVPN